MNIAILTPSRERASMLKGFINSVYSLCKYKNNVYFYNYIDLDDPQLNQYKSLDLPNTFNTYGDPIPVSKSWNIIAEKAKKADIFIMGNDDQLYRTQNWDEILIQKILEYNKSLYCMWFEDLINGKNHCAFPIIPKKWYELVGYFTPGIFNFGYNDAWIFDIAKKLNCTKFIPEVIAEHMHFSQRKMIPDNTTKRSRVGERGNLWTKDKIIWDKTETNRQQIADKLRIYLNESK